MGGTRVEAGQRSVIAPPKDEKTDPRNGPRACIVIALVIIAIVAINLARHSTPCYEFFKSPGGITLLTGVPVLGIAMIIFWPNGKPKEDQKGPPPPTPSQGSRLSNPSRSAITASALSPPSASVVSPAFVIFKEWPFSGGEDGLFDMTEEEAGQIALQLGEDEYFIYKSRDVYGYRTKDLNYTSRVIETRANSRRVYPAPSNRAFDLFCSMNLWKYRQFDIRRDPLDNVVALSQEEVDKLERVVKNQTSVIPFYLQGETREKSGYSALSPSGRLSLYKSLKELDKALSVHGSCLQLQRKGSFGIGDIQITEEKLSNSTDPPTLFDDEIGRLKAGFLRGYFDNWTYLYYSTLSGKVRRMAIIDGRLRNEEVENLEQDRRQMTHANMSELFLGRIEPGLCLWDLDSNSKPPIILSESEVIKLRKKLSDERAFFIIKNVKTLMFELHTKGGVLRAEKREELLKPTGDDWTKYYPKQVVPDEGVGMLSLRAVPQKPAGYDVNLPRLSTCAAYYLSSFARDPLIGFYYRDINRDKVVYIQNGMQDVLEDKAIAQHRALRAPNVVEVYVGEGQ